MVVGQMFVGKIAFNQMTWSKTYKIVCTDVLVLHHLVNCPFYQSSIFLVSLEVVDKTAS